MSLRLQLRSWAILLGIAATAVVLPTPTADAAKLRRPFNSAVNVNYGYDNLAGSGCRDFNCGGVCYDGHGGTDFPVSYGTAIVAAARGKVTYTSSGCGDVGSYGSTCGGGFGNYVRVDHEDGTVTYYAHMKNGSIAVSNGQTVTCGQQLGLSASSGSSTGNHLHFELRVNGNRRDPFSGSCSQATGYWVNPGTYPYNRPSTDCESTCACTPGQTGTSSCGNCGTQSRTCQSNCQWGSWGGCSGQGSCGSGQTQSQGCGNCGTQTRTCQSNCSWGSWGGCNGQGCAPGQVDHGSCGNCGTRSRTCQSNCQYGSWSSCTGEGPCAVAATESRSCCDCGSQSRTCSGSCQWGDWSSCSGPDPQGGNEVCNTREPGPCAEGRMRCVSGCKACVRIYEPIPEKCDEIDNDCNGIVDDGNPTQMGVPPPAYAATLVDSSVPSALEPGQSGAVWAVFQNNGSATWPKDTVWLGAVTEEGKNLLYDPDTWKAYDVVAMLDADVAPGETGTFSWFVRAPDDGAAVSQVFRLMDPAGHWLSCPTPELNVTVLGKGTGAGLGGGVTEPSANSPKTDIEGRGTCACRVGVSTPDVQPWWLFGALALVFVRRRR